jgi:hypothetical protein
VSTCGRELLRGWWWLTGLTVSFMIFKASVQNVLDTPSYGYILDTPHSKCSATKLGFISSDTRTLRINSYWSAENRMLIYDTPFHDVMFGVWCAICADRIESFPSH